MLTSEWNREIALEVAKEEGEEKGRVDGAMKKALEAAKILKEKGINVNTIEEATGLCVEDILRL